MVVIRTNFYLLFFLHLQIFVLEAQPYLTCPLTSWQLSWFTL